MGAAFEQFKDSLELSVSLKRIEREKFPVRNQANMPSIKGLRGGAAVLMVAAFEFYIKKLFEGNIARLNSVPPTIDLQKLPDKLKVKIVYDSLQNAMEGPKYSAKLPKVDRINDVLSACRLLIGEHINPTAFSDTNSNPNGDTVKEKFKEIGIPDIYGNIKVRFETKWGTPVADTFIKDKLDEIVRTRHVVAHTADTLNITKAGQNEALKFLKILAELLEIEMDKQIKNLLVVARK